MLFLHEIFLVFLWLFAVNFTLLAGPFQLLSYTIHICGSSGLGPIPPQRYNGWLNSLRCMFQLLKGYSLEMAIPPTDF
jgi:hypothetical protein